MHIEKMIELFNGKRISATAFNIKCSDDIDSIRDYLINKYGAENITENDLFFIVKDGKKHAKPWIPRNRTGIFKASKHHFSIETESSSAVGRLNPRRSIFPLSCLSFKDKDTLICMIDKKNNYYVEYKIID